MRFSSVLAACLCSFSLQADPYFHIQGLAVETLHENAETVSYKTLAAFCQEMENREVLEGNVVCIQEITTDQDAETLYELLKPYYAHFIYVFPTEDALGSLWMSKYTVDILHQYLSSPIQETRVIVLETGEERITVWHSEKVKPRKRALLELQLCSNEKRNQVDVDASHKKNLDTGESEVRGGIKYQRECENGNRFHAGVEQSLKKDQEGKKTSETKASAGINF